MKKRLGIFLTIVISLILLNINIVFALDDSMVIKNMDITIDVTKDNVYIVTEKISVNFLKERHGIFRNIPIIKATLSVRSIKDDLGNTYDYTIENEGQDKIIKIGSPDYTVKGLKTYIINYKINYKGSLTDLSYNIVGPEWDTTIDSVKFKINMPKEFDSNELQIFSGTRKSTNNNKVNFNVEGNTIIGETTAPLNPNEGITILLSLGEGYFTPPKLINVYTIISLILITFVPLLAFISSSYSNKKRRIAKMNTTKVIGFYPPKELNPIDLAYISYPNKTLKDNELTSILFYYANKGLIKIHNINGNYELKQCKNVTRKDFQNDYEFNFFTSLFKLSSKKDDIIRVTDFKGSKLSFMESFILNSRAENLNKKSYFENLPFSKNILPYVFTFPFAFLGLAFFLYSISYSMDFTMGFIIAIVLFNGLIVFPISIIIRKVNFLINVMLVAVLVPWIIYFILNVGGSNSIIGYIPVIAIYIWLCFSTLVSQAFPISYSHTIAGCKILGETEGYKEFIKTAKIEELKMLINDNPNYYYDVLPYAICLGITDIFENKFKDLKYNEPQWYYGNNMYPIFMYNNFSKNYSNKLTNEYRDYVRQQQAARSNSSSSGGGSVGGGSVGGGGGGSW